MTKRIDVAAVPAITGTLYPRPTTSHAGRVNASGSPTWRG